MDSVPLVAFLEDMYRNLLGKEWSLAWWKCWIYVADRFKWFIGDLEVESMLKVCNLCKNYEFDRL